MSTSNDLREGDSRFRREAVKHHLAKVEGHRAIAQRLDCTLAQLALRWVIQQGGATAAIAGAKRASQVRENAGAGALVILPAVMDEIDAILAERG